MSAEKGIAPHCHSIKEKNYKTPGIDGLVFRGSSLFLSEDFVGRSSKAVGTSELFRQTPQRYGLRRQIQRSGRFQLNDPIRLNRMAAQRALPALPSNIFTPRCHP